MEYYKVGIIQTTHGLRGDLKIKSLTDFDRFKKGERLFIKHNNEMIEVKVKLGRVFGTGYLVTFEGFEDINLVEKFHSDELYIHESDRDELDENEFYYSDLIGLKAYNEAGIYKGEVIYVREVPQGHILEIKNNKVSLIPFRDEFIKSIDEEKIVIKEIEGLFCE